MPSDFAGICTTCCASVSKVTPVADNVKVTLNGFSVLLLTFAASCALSPTVKKRGVTGRMSSGFVATTSTLLSPTLVSAVTPTPWNVHVVRLSGSVSVTLPLPEVSVLKTGFQYAVSEKSSRTSTLGTATPLAALLSIAGAGSSCTATTGGWPGTAVAASIAAASYAASPPPP